MRKVLLATTALVAMSVTAAQADLSISGNYEWEYTTDDTGTANGVTMDTSTSKPQMQLTMA